MEDSIKGRTQWIWLLVKAFLVTLVSESESKEATPNGDATSVASEEQQPDDMSKVHLPRKLPSIVDIKRKLPPHCLDPRVSTSMYYMFKDIALVSFMFVVGELMWTFLPTVPFLALTPVFWFVQGTFFTALFVVGHDCGHGSFSHHDVLNDVVGTAMHTFLMAPFYEWKLSHKNHHKNTGNIDKDEVFYPIRKSQNSAGTMLPYFGLGTGWYGYLLLGYKPRPVNHMNPLQAMYRNHMFGCITSLACMAVWASCLYWYASSQGFWKLLFHYIGPDFVFASYTVLITFLHHTEDDIPWYSDHLWENVRGQLSSVDRHYGLVHDVIHNIGTHQIHHLFPKVPHYHLEEATRVFRKEFPELVKVREERIFTAFVRMFKKYAKQCIIPDDTAVHIYK